MKLTKLIKIIYEELCLSEGFDPIDKNRYDKFVMTDKYNYGFTNDNDIFYKISLLHKHYNNEPALELKYAWYNKETKRMCYDRPDNLNDNSKTSNTLAFIWKYKLFPAWIKSDIKYVIMSAHENNEKRYNTMVKLSKMVEDDKFDLNEQPSNRIVILTKR